MTTSKLTHTALMLTLIIILSVLENMLPPIPALPPGVHLGLSNIVTMYALFVIDKKTAFSLNILKAVFGAVTRGPIAGSLSLIGGLLSICVIITFKALLKDKITYLALSVCGAVFHNIGQLIGIIILLNNPATVFYLPVLIISGVIMGSVTGTILNVVMPRLNQLERWRNH